MRALWRAVKTNAHNFNFYCHSILHKHYNMQCLSFMTVVCTAQTSKVLWTHLANDTQIMQHSEICVNTVANTNIINTGVELRSKIWLKFRQWLFQLLCFCGNTVMIMMHKALHHQQHISTLEMKMSYAFCWLRGILEGRMKGKPTRGRKKTTYDERHHGDKNIQNGQKRGEGRIKWAYK